MKYYFNINIFRMCFKYNKITISYKIKFCKVNNKIKIHPTFFKKKACCICYDNINIKKLKKCENNKCIDGYVCKECIKKSNNSLKKCPLCRNESNIFLEKKYTIVQVSTPSELNLNNSEENNFYNIKKIKFLKKCIFFVYY